MGWHAEALHRAFASVLTVACISCCLLPQYQFPFSFVLPLGLPASLDYRWGWHEQISTVLPPPMPSVKKSGSLYCAQQRANSL